ncbi:MAG: hypothetical protein VX438_15525 [Planctomycetota bacterium]|nr:hypothetical protein [Planctomycetota bacterium]
MNAKFDPYSEWLDISQAEQPADYYRLLGLKTFEPDSETIRENADERMVKVRKHQNGKHSKKCQRILNELAAAKGCLLNQKLRRIYDLKLAKILKSKKLPNLAVPTELLPEQSIPENYDPFLGTANVDESYDPLEPVAAAPVWPFVVAGVTLLALILGIVLVNWS